MIYKKSAKEKQICSCTATINVMKYFNMVVAVLFICGKDLKLKHFFHVIIFGPIDMTINSMFVEVIPSVLLQESRMVLLGIRHLDQYSIFCQI